MQERDPRDRLIVALDLPDVGEAERIVAQIGDAARFYKIGMELAYGGGLALAPKLVAAGKRVFIDLKLHDIPNTVERATAQIARLGATFLTVHAYPQTMRAAVAGAKGTSLKLLAVSVLTSSDDADLAEAGYALSVRALVERAGASQAQAAGIDGLVCSAAEGKRLRAAVGPAFALVTPGIRLAEADVGDQEARRDAGFGDRRGGRLSGGRTPDHRRPRSARRRRAHCRRDRRRDLSLASKGRPCACRPLASRPTERRMPKGYVITRADITDAEAYARYAAGATKAIADHGGKVLARGGRHEALEGAARARNVVVEFESYDQARRYFYSAAISGRAQIA